MTDKQAIVCKILVASDMVGKKHHRCDYCHRTLDIWLNCSTIHSSSVSGTTNDRKFEHLLWNCVLYQWSLRFISMILTWSLYLEIPCIVESFKIPHSGHHLSSIIATLSNLTPVRCAMPEMSPLCPEILLSSGLKVSLSDLRLREVRVIKCINHMPKSKYLMKTQFNTSLFFTLLSMECIVLRTTGDSGTPHFHRVSKASEDKT